MEKASKVVLDFAKERDWEQFHTPENLAKSISIEAGELLECFQWDSNYDEDEVRKELADVVIYCIHLANRLGVRLEDIVLDKMKEVAKKYPVGKSKGNSKKYTEF